MTKIRKYLFFLGLFFLIFSPHVLVFGVIVKTVYIFVVLPGLLGAYTYFVKRNKSIVEKRTIIFLLGTLIYFIIYSGIDSFKDISVIKQILMGFITFFSSYYFVINYKKLYGDHFITRLFLDLNRIGIIHSLIVIITFLSTGFKVFLYSFISITDLSKRYLFGIVENERYQGIVHSGFSFLSTTHALLLIIGVWGFYMNSKKPRMTEMILFILGQIIIFISILLIGRSGLIVVFLFLTFLILYRINDFFRGMKLSKRNLSMVIILFTIIVIILTIVDYKKYKKNIDYAFELVIYLKDKGTLDRSTSGIIQNHFIFPNSAFELIVGNGNFGRSSSFPNIPSDVGYVLFINGAGIFGMMVGFSFYFVGFYYAFKYRRLNLYLYRFIFTSIIALIILNLKDYYYIGYGDFCQIYFILICIFGREIENKQEFTVLIPNKSDTFSKTY